MKAMAMLQAMGSQGDEARDREAAEAREKESWSAIRRRLDRTFNSTNFDMALGVVIVANIACIIMETNGNAACAEHPNNDHCESGTIFMFNLVFLAIYTIEASLRIFTYRCPRLLSDFPFMFDFLIVSLGYVDLVLGLAGLEDLPGFAMLRIFRVARLARAIRILRGIPELYAMVRSFFAAMSAMFWGFLIILMLLMMWAILAVEMIHPINIEIPKDDQWCDEAFSTVQWCMLIFFQTLVAGDSWGNCSVRVIQAEPWTFFIFAGATAVREEDQMQALQDSEQHRRDAASDVFEMCKEIDTDGDNTITLVELMKAHGEKPELRKAFQLLKIDEHDIESLFQSMDTDGSGSLSYEDFAKHLQKSTDGDLRTQIMLVKMQVEEIRKEQVEQMAEMMSSLKAVVQECLRESAPHLGLEPKRLDPLQVKHSCGSVNMAYAKVKLVLEPNSGNGFELKGVEAQIMNGVVAGFPGVEVKVKLTDGAFHPVDSSVMAFEIAGRAGFKEGAQNCKPVVLEPIMKVEVTTPEDYMGGIIGDINSRRGQISNMDDKNNLKVLTAFVPLATMFSYIAELRSLSKGRATFSMEFHKYEPLPGNLADELMGKSDQKKKK